MLYIFQEWIKGLDSGLILTQVMVEVRLIITALSFVIAVILIIANLEKVHYTVFLPYSGKIYSNNIFTECEIRNIFSSCQMGISSKGRENMPILQAFWVRHIVSDWCKWNFELPFSLNQIKKGFIFCQLMMIMVLCQAYNTQ